MVDLTVVDGVIATELYHRLETPVAERAHRLRGHAAVLGTRGMRAHDDVAAAYELDGRIDVVFGRHGRGADIHLQDFRAAGPVPLREVVAPPRFLGSQRNVTVSQSFCGPESQQVADELARPANPVVAEPGDRR